MKYTLLLLVLLALFLPACGGNTLAVSMSTPSATVTNTPLPTATLTATATSLPTQTPVPEHIGSTVSNTCVYKCMVMED